jgi:tetratricopeptide (TPR) repeat protein
MFWLKWYYKGSILILLMALSLQKAPANINAIDFSLISSSPQLKSKIDFLRQNQRLYDHWSPEWNATIPKQQVINNLTSLYDGLVRPDNKNAETYLLLGDIAHYLYNLNMEEFYNKAVENYKKAGSLSPNDYRVYWFLANHYSLSAQPTLAIQTYQVAQKFIPERPSFLFWTDYSIACANAGMVNTAKFAAHQASLTQGRRTDIEDQISVIAKNQSVATPVDTTLQDKDVWQIPGRKGGNMIFNNTVVGLQFQVDSNWQLQLGGYDKHICYATISPHEATTKTGEKIGYSFLVLVRVPDQGQTLQQFLDMFTAKTPDRKKTSTTLNKIYGGLAYEMRDPATYPDCGGSHGYAIAFERDVPQYPGMKFEMPLQIPKNGDGKVSYYTMEKKYARLNTKLYYFILLDSCEHIHDESLAVFNKFLDELVVE